MTFAADLLPLPERVLPGPAASQSPLVLAKAPDASRPAASSSGTVAAQRPEPAAPAPPRVGMVARFRRRLFDPLGNLSGKSGVQAGGGQPGLQSPPSGGKPLKPALGREVGFKASLAEFLLINRLRARIRPRAAQPVQSPEVLQRAEHIIYVTCSDWFGEGDSRSGDLGTRL